jgi:hypothetical protein
VSALLDYVDGEVARLTGKVSNVGLFLDLTNHEVTRNSLFLALGYSVVRSTNNLVYFVLAFSAAVFVSAYQTSFFFAERVAPGGVIKDYASQSRPTCIIRSRRRDPTLSFDERNQARDFARRNIQPVIVGSRILCAGRAGVVLVAGIPALLAANARLIANSAREEHAGCDKNVIVPCS